MGHRYDYPIDVTDDSAPARVLRLVGEGKRVLEVGAGPGSMTRILRNLYNCRVTAIEIDNESIPMLSPHCERVYHLDLNDPLWPNALENEGRFDVVIAADVLEHLYDPWSTVKRIKTFMEPEGYLIASVPHAGHNAVIACLLAADFEYRDVGLLDRTHIRFFGIRNIQDLFDKADLAIVEAQIVIHDPDDSELRDTWSRIPASMREALSNNKFGRVYQTVLKTMWRREGLPEISLLDLPPELLAAGNSRS